MLFVSREFVCDFGDESLDRVAIEDDPVATHAPAIGRSRQIADVDSMMFRAANSGAVCAAAIARLRGVPGASQGVSSGSTKAVQDVVAAADHNWGESTGVGRPLGGGRSILANGSYRRP